MSPTYFGDKREVKVYQLRRIKALFIMDFKMIVFWGRYQQNKVFPISKIIAEILIFVTVHH